MGRVPVSPLTRLLMRGVLALMMVASTVALSVRVASADVPTVAAASSLQFALPELVEAFQDESGRELRLNVGSSGNLRRQILQGAPFELFLSADELNALALHDAGRTLDAGKVYAVGRLAWLQRESRDDMPSGEDPLVGVREAIAAHAKGEARSRIALANPEHAPYGIAAKQALEHAGLWEQTTALRILGENVSQAAQFALAAESRGGLVAWSLAIAPPLAERSRHLLIPESWHDPLVQRMVLLEGSGESARAFYAWLQRREAREILERYGFSSPGDDQGEAWPDDHARE